MGEGDDGDDGDKGGDGDEGMSAPGPPEPTWSASETPPSGAPANHRSTDDRGILIKSEHNLNTI